MRRLTLGLEIGYDPTWPAGFTYVRNLVYSLLSLAENEVPKIHLLPVDSKTVGMISDLEKFSQVEVEKPSCPPHLLGLCLVLRRVSRKVLQPRVGRPLHKAFSGLDVTYPGWGTPVPGTPQINWIPDMQHVHLPQLFSEDELQERSARFSSIAEGEGIVIFSSRSALDDFVQQYPWHRVTTRVWNFTSTIGAAERGGRDPRIAFKLPEYFLYVANQFWMHKDHLTVFKALLTLRERGIAPVVVCTGKLSDTRNPNYAMQIRDFLAENALTDQVKVLGMVERKDQVQILRHAAAVIQPSRFEGWSTVIEDARAIGRPLIASDIPVHLEQAPNASFYETGSPQSLAEVIERALPAFAAGPDPVAERKAAAEAEARRVRAATDFLRIADEAVELNERLGSWS